MKVMLETRNAKKTPSSISASTEAGIEEAKKRLREVYRLALLRAEDDSSVKEKAAGGTAASEETVCDDDAPSPTRL
jgi:hypothetical protein